MRLPKAPLSPRVSETLSLRNASQVNLYHALANSPQSVEAWLDFIWAIRDTFTTPRDLRELLILQVAARENSHYEWHHHIAMARAAGVTEKKIAALATQILDTPGVFSETERIALQLGSAIAAGHVGAELSGAAVAQFGAAGYVELALTASAYVMVSRVLDALDVEVEAD